MTDLLLHGRTVRTVFDLLGDKEDDITYSVGWALARSDAFLSGLLQDLLAEQSIGDERVVALQEPHDLGGFTDIEIRTSTCHIIVEAKRGWVAPQESQLLKYLPRFSDDGRMHRFVVMAEGSEPFMRQSLRLPDAVGPVPVLYCNWKQIAGIARKSRAAGTHAEKHLLDELCLYIEGLMSMQNQRSNLVYVVSLGADTPSWSTISWRAYVEKNGVYFHPMGPHGGWPRDPVNYLAFRYDARLQSIHHVESYEVCADLSERLGTIDGEQWRAWPQTFVPHFLYYLGPAIRPSHTVSNGRIVRSMRVWCAIDLLLTSQTISDARDETQKRLHQEVE